MAAGRSAWVLNLDADLELATPHGYTPKKSVLAAMASFVPVLFRALCREDDVLVDDTTPPNAAAGLVGHAFCPTPRALALLARAGATPAPSPAVEILRRVNCRAFAASLGQTLPGAAFVKSDGEARAQLAIAPPIGRGWRVKRAFGMTGRGQRTVQGRATDADLAFVRAGLNEGGVQLEPDVAIVQEYAIHGVVTTGGARFGRVVEQTCDARGAWLATRPLVITGAHEPVLVERLTQEVALVAVALVAAGYAGPFGVDAYTYRGRDGALGFQPRSEINARYSMGFGIGMSATTT